MLAMLPMAIPIIGTPAQANNPTITYNQLGESTGMATIPHVDMELVEKYKPSMKGHCTAKQDIHVPIKTNMTHIYMLRSFG
mmetsp:Transcript_33293/g.48195  ORF Transcript_33293/g.48195 Transcript_33293/m.48195 type:complete len:81 (-) Transcript_33293:496-738(-)